MCHDLFLYLFIQLPISISLFKLLLSWHPSPFSKIGPLPSLNWNLPVLPCRPTCDFIQTLCTCGIHIPGIFQWFGIPALNGRRPSQSEANSVMKGRVAQRTRGEYNPHHRTSAGTVEVWRAATLHSREAPHVKQPIYLFTQTRTNAAPVNFYDWNILWLHEGECLAFHKALPDQHCSISCER